MQIGISLKPETTLSEQILKLTCYIFPIEFGRMKVVKIDNKKYTLVNVLATNSSFKSQWTVLPGNTCLSLVSKDKRLGLKPDIWRRNQIKSTLYHIQPPWSNLTPAWIILSLYWSWDKTLACQVILQFLLNIYIKYLYFKIPNENYYSGSGGKPSRKIKLTGKLSSWFMYLKKYVNFSKIWREFSSFNST